MTDYFQHQIPVTDDKPTSYKNYTGIRYKNNSIDFAKPGLTVKTQNKLQIASESFIAKAEGIKIESDRGDIKINATAALKLIAEVFSCGSHLSIDNNGIKFSSEHIVLAANNIQTSCGISCEGDAHSCPQQDGLGNPHVGGCVQTASQNVFINNKGVARHGDFAPCKTTPNQIVSHMNTITVNGKPIAHQLANTQHQGKIMSSSALVAIAPACISTSQTNDSTQIDTNELHIKLLSPISSKSQTKLYMQFKERIADTTIKNNIATVSRLTQHDLTGIIQLTVI